MRAKRRRHGYGHSSYALSRKRCTCETHPDSPSTFRGAEHFTECSHSELDETTQPLERKRAIRRIDL